jgi:hypothetical protein
MAMYKVHTDQVHLRMSELKLPRSSFARTLTATSQSQGKLKPRPRPSSPEKFSAEDVVHVVANPTAQANLPKLLPAPVLLPTAYSSQKIVYDLDQIPSSPPTDDDHLAPAAQSPPKARFYATPAAKRVQMLANYDGAAVHGASDEKESCGYEDRDDLTSSVVKGKAASSLLELRRGG